MKFLSLAVLLVIAAFAMAAPAEENETPQLAAKAETQPAEGSAAQPTEGSAPKSSSEHIQEQLKKIMLLPANAVADMKNKYDNFSLFHWGKK